ncbi:MULTISPECIES: ABC transporter permease [unclassified Bradyrhizobium]|uniref:ABC transporter permease n=1 Tax=unclassified Bradyrhizobium TaxID=2631580 RepID=UPI001FFC15F0|nr:MULTISPECIES: ABC transporter permease [unclassified Bradyrhizobium]
MERRARDLPLLSYVRKLIISSNTLPIFLVLVFLTGAFAIARPAQFASFFNLRNIATDGATLLVMAVGMTYVLIVGGIDLSIGSVLVFCGIAAAKIMIAIGGEDAGWISLAAGLVVGILAGAAWGLLNGLLIAKLRLPALIVTLGTLGAALGASHLLTNGVDVRGVPLRLTELGIGAILGVPLLAIQAAIVTFLGWFFLRFTRFGLHTYAVGSNIEAARRAGINVERHLIKVYAIQGSLAGLAGLMSLARFNTTTIAGHSSDNLNVIASVVLGGTSVFGGSGSVFGTLVGVLIPAVLQNGFIIIGVQSFWQSIAVGAVLIAAVYVDQSRRGLRRRP